MPIVLLTPHNEALPAPDVLTTLQINHLWRRHVQHALEAYFVPRIGFDFENPDVLETYNHFMNLLLDLNDTEEIMGVPIGGIIAWVGATIPEHFIPCNGATLQRVDYPLLYAAIDDVFIINADEFFLPETRDRFLRGANVGEDVGVQEGSHTATLAIENLPPHSHNVTTPTGNAGSNNGRLARGDVTTLATYNGFTEETVGSGDEFDIRPLHVTVDWLIRYE